MRWLQPDMAIPWPPVIPIVADAALNALTEGFL
jgi:hypothetical protein